MIDTEQITVYLIGETKLKYGARDKFYGIIEHKSSNFDEILEYKDAMFKSAKLLNELEYLRFLEDCRFNLLAASSIIRNKFIDRNSALYFFDTSLSSFVGNNDIIIDKELYTICTLPIGDIEPYIKNLYKLKYNTWWNRMLIKLKIIKY